MWFAKSENNPIDLCIISLWFIYLGACKLETGADSKVCNSRMSYWLSKYTFLNSVACILEYTLAWTHSITASPAINIPHQKLIRNLKPGNRAFYPSRSKAAMNTQEKLLRMLHVCRKTQHMHHCLHVPSACLKIRGENIYSSTHCRSHGNSTEQNQSSHRVLFHSQVQGTHKEKQNKEEWIFQHTSWHIWIQCLANRIAPQHVPWLSL